MTAPVVGSTAARFFSLVEPTLENDPPRNTLPLLTAIARTALPVTFGFHGSSAPVLILKAAAWLRVTSPVPAGSPAGRTDVNWPPMYTVDPDTTISFTLPFVW